MKCSRMFRLTPRDSKSLSRLRCRHRHRARLPLLRRMLQVRPRKGLSLRRSRCRRRVQRQRHQVQCSVAIVLVHAVNGVEVRQSESIVEAICCAIRRNDGRVWHDAHPRVGMARSRHAVRTPVRGFSLVDVNRRAIAIHGQMRRKSGHLRSNREHAHSDSIQPLSPPFPLSIDTRMPSTTAVPPTLRPAINHLSSGETMNPTTPSGLIGRGGIVAVQILQPDSSAMARLFAT